MIWFVLFALALLVLAPVLIALGRRVPARGTRDLAMALHREQLAELERDLAEGRIAAGEHATAVLEVQRRLLAAADLPEGAGKPGSSWPGLVVIITVPIVAFGLYLVAGQPGVPSVPSGAGSARQQQIQQDAALIGQLRARLAVMNPDSDTARQGYVLLGNAEAARGNEAAAIEAWQTAIKTRFDPAIALRIVELSLRRDQGLTDESAALLRRALAAAPADAPWREAAEALLQKSGR